MKLVDKVIEVKKRKSDSYDQVIKDLKNEQFENIFSPHESFRTSMLVKKLKAKRKIGFKKWWNSLIYTHRLSKPKHLPDALRQLYLLYFLSPELNQFFSNKQGAQVFASQNGMKTPQLPAWASMQREFELRLPAGFIQSNKKRAVLAPGSQWVTKRWTPEGFLEVGKNLQTQGFEILIVGSKDEKPICDKLAQKLIGAQNFCGQTSLIELLSLLKKSDLLIVNDSGVMHMGAIAGLPTVAIYGPTTLDLGYRPWQSEARVVEKSLPCRPCGKHGHDKCPIGTHECMKSIAASEVLSAVDSLSLKA